MPVCPVCHAEESREERVDEVFRIDGEYVLVGGIPAIICARCGEQAFSRETVDKIRTMVHGEAKATKSVSMQVFDFASRLG
jgi:YgiT-type zinc finger domain-containing protein